MRNSIISPFGFEVFNNLEYRKKKFNRFYLYVGINDEINLGRVEFTVFKLFTEKLKDYLPKIYKDLAIVALRSGEHFILKNAQQFDKYDVCLVIEARKLDSITILEDYARYLLCTPKAIIDGTLTEVSTFMIYRESRARIYQLYVILCELYDIDYSEFQDFVMKQISINKFFNLRYYYSGKKINKPTVNELILFDKILTDLRVIQNVNNLDNSACTQIFVRSYHGDNILENYINQKVYSDLNEKIRVSYNYFWNL